MLASNMYSYRYGLNNILVLLISGIPITMPTVLSATLAIGYCHPYHHWAYPCVAGQYHQNRLGIIVS